MQTRERAHCALSVFPFVKKKKKFFFLRDADSRKSTLCLFCVPIHKKKKKKERFHRTVLSGLAASANRFILPSTKRNFIVSDVLIG